uniref:COX assembly mitochondrial protein n=1 Tax=Sinocyclocheilus grahami TaxID=75366 RepID=A0A672L7X5_SINGR
MCVRVRSHCLSEALEELSVYLHVYASDDLHMYQISLTLLLSGIVLLFCVFVAFFMVFRCREENAALKECLTLQENREYEQTGIPAKNRKQKLPTST